MTLCTCQERAEFIDARERQPELMKHAEEPAKCRTHPIQTIIGNRMVSTAMRESSAIHAPGWYEETLVFLLSREGKRMVAQPRFHREGMALAFTDEELRLLGHTPDWAADLRANLDEFDLEVSANLRGSDE